MKIMKLGSSPDIFFRTEDNIITLDNDVPSDLIVHINNTSYHLHKFALVPKCGVLQETFTDSRPSSSHSIELHDVPGGEEGFELCVKFCYGIEIHLSAENFVLAYCAAKFLHMSDFYINGNFVPILESFFRSRILDGWKDSIVALQSTVKLPDFCDEFKITRRCIDAIVDKILLPPPKVTWSFTYSKRAYERRLHAVPIDWWTKDLTYLEPELFCSIIVSVRSTNMISPQLIGEALLIYATCNLLPSTPDSGTLDSSRSHTSQSFEQQKQMLETLSLLIPSEQGSVSTRCLLKLLRLAHQLDISSSTKTELIRRCSAQLEDATFEDLLLICSSSTDQEFYDIDLVKAVLKNYLRSWRRLAASEPEDKSSLIRSIQNIGNLMDSLLQIVARDPSLPVSDVVSLAKALPSVARPNHDQLYQAIDIYLKEHLNLSKDEKKSLCRILDCEKLSHEVSAHAVKNELLPLRTVVQVLFFQQERAANLKPLDELSKVGIGSSTPDTKSSKKTPSGHSLDLLIAATDITPGKQVSRIPKSSKKFHFVRSIKKMFNP